MKTILLAAGLAVAAFVQPAMAAEFTAGSITVSEPWARATPPTARVGGGFMQIVNNGEQPDRLVGASSPIAPDVELHTHVREGEVMRMRPVDHIDLPPGETVSMQPGGLHVMFIGLEKPLVQDEVVPVTLEFEQAGSLEIQMEVRGVGAMLRDVPEGHQGGHGHRGQHH
ncbi:copper chaperone PCu(A)C [Telmatospirillum sp. J64-1]|uniref:copper chaperone PCu(A)C n=1 Tax=Telmatospirillum sp. J64-1 TaxID=2502183 RepID=UPI00115E0AD7|nr:copper chaperone PCu(A)C [Telmatospirillum sp. J64-1]